MPNGRDQSVCHLVRRWVDPTHVIHEWVAHQCAPNHLTRYVTLDVSPNATHEPTTRMQALWMTEQHVLW